MSNPDVPFARAFDTAQAAVQNRFFSPGWQITELLDGSRSKINAAIATLDEYCYALIHARRSKGDFLQRRDLLSRFMSLRDDGASDAQEGAFTYLHNDKYLRDVILNVRRALYIR